jgi:hypothetical protein
MNKNVLYISILGMSEPLGKSQVLEYLSDLSENYSMFLYSFEKDLRKKIINGLSEKMENEKIEWSFQKYSNKHGILSTVRQIFSSYKELKNIIKKNNIKLIHARSLIPVVIALFLKRKYKLKVIFDIRGFQIDEKAEVGRLTKGSILYKLLKKIEHYSYKKSDSIVTLTYASIPYISQYCNPEKISVISTCANKQLFKRLSMEEKMQFKQEVGYASTDKILLHVGAVSNWYDFDNELKIVSKLMLDDPNLQFLIINKSEHNFISNKISEFNIDTRRLKVIEVVFYDMFKYLNIVDASIFIIKATFSKTASAPTKFAENLACGLFSITNNGIGDMNKFFQENKTIGYSFDVKEIDSNINGICENIVNGMNSKKIMLEYDKVYNEFLSKEMAIKKYSNIYNHLLSEN